MINLLNIFSDFADKLWQIAILVAVVAILNTCLKSKGGRIFLGVALSFAFIVVTAYCGIQLNYYYTASGGIYGKIVSLYNPNQVHITSSVEYSFENVVMTLDADNTYSARITSDSVLELVLEEDATYGVYINDMPCNYVEITNDYVIAKYRYSFLDEDLSVQMDDTLTLKFAFYTNSTYLSVSTDGGAEAVKYWNYYFNKNVFEVTIDNKGYTYEQDINFGTGDVSDYSIISYYLNNELYIKQVYKNGSTINLPLSNCNYTTTEGSVVDSSYIITQSVSINMERTNFEYLVYFDANGGDGSMTPQTHVHGISKGLTTTAFTKMDYVFMGWALTSDGAVEYTDGATVINLVNTPGESITLYAVWTNEYYTAQIFVMGTTGTYSTTATHASQQLSAISGTTVTLASEALKIANIAVENGVEYSHATDLEGNIITTAEIASGNSTVIRFYFERKAYTLTFDANGGTISQTSVVRYYRQVYGTLPTPIREGYTFDGWYTSDNTKVSSTITMGTSDITIYAHWSEN